MSAFDDFTDAYAEEVDRVGLQNSFDFNVKTLPHLQLPSKVLIISDLHAGDGGLGKHVDPFKNSGMEKETLDLLDLYQDYFWILHEVWDIWRGRTKEACVWAHPGLSARIDGQLKGMCYELDSNHVRDELVLPRAVIFEGYGKKFYFDHGDMWDWPNCRGWKVGRMCVRAADELGIDPETSPHVTSADRHAKVRGLRQELADNNPGWQFFSGHTHYFENPIRFQVVTRDFRPMDEKRKIFCVYPEEFDEKTMEKVGVLQNNHNTGSPISGKLQYYLIQEGVIIPME